MSFPSKTALDYAGDAFPASEPQAASDRQHVNDSYGQESMENESHTAEYKFFLANGQLDVSGEHDHDQLRERNNVPSTHVGPMAVGNVTVEDGVAIWEVISNMSASTLAKELQKFTRESGWDWGGMTDRGGDPIGDDEKLAKVHIRDHDTGEVLRLTIHAGRLVRSSKVTDAVREFAADHNLRVAEYPGGSNMTDQIKNHSPMGEDLELKNIYDPNQTIERSKDRDRMPDGTYKCPDCGRLFHRWHEYSLHRESELPEPTLESEDGKFPEINEQNYHEMPSFHEAGWQFTAEKQPKDMFKDPVPFIYDIDEDHIYVGHPGARHAEIELPSKLTPGGIVEGEYQPGGKVLVKSMSDTPYSVRHMVGLWYWQHPEFEVTGVELTLPDGNTKKIASTLPEVQSVVDAYVTRGYWVNEDGMEFPLTTLREGANATDLCNEVAADFARFAQEQGLPAEEYDVPGAKHTVTKIGTTFVDFTANQFGDYEWPRIYGEQTKVAHRSVGAYVISQAAADPAVHEAWQALTEAGGKVYAVGGVVRDALMGKPAKDVDLLVTGLPHEAVNGALKKLPGRVDLTGKDFGVYRYNTEGYEVEVALPRVERSTGGRRVDFDVSVDPHLPIETDLERRDFTANAIAVDLSDGTLVDPFGGESDIAQKNLKTVHPNSFKEDPTRLVRALVAHGRHGLDPDEATRQQMVEHAHSLSGESAERIQAELDKLMKTDNPAKAILLAHDTGVLRHILPEVDECFDFDQRNPHHNYDLGTHLLNVLTHTARQTDDPDVRLAALLHDIGKPKSQWINPETGIGHYYKNDKGEGDDHETVGAQMAAARMKALKYPNARINRVQHLVQHHMYPDFSGDKGARKFIHRVGDEHAEDLMVLREADRSGKGTDDYQATKTPVDKQRELVQQARDRKDPVGTSNLAINGNDLIGLGFKPGPAVGEILRTLTDLVVESPEYNEKKTLLDYVRNELTTS